MEYDPHAINTVSELIEALEQYDPDAPVRWAHQPAWPMEYMIGQVVLTRDNTVWLGAGQQLGYLPDAANSALGWSDGWAS
jgi:hypothetical protein